MTRKKLIHYINIPILIGIFFVLAPLSVLAQQSISATPLIFDIKAKPRDIIPESIRITSGSGAKLNVYAFVNNVTRGKEGGVQEFEQYVETDKSKSLANWIELQRGVIELGPGEVKDLDFTIRVGPYAVPGQYHAKIVFSTGRNKDEAEKRLSSGPSIIVNLEITEDINEFLQLKKFLADKVFYSGQAAVFNYKLENRGNKDLIPKGEILIFDRRGKEVGAVPVNEENVIITPAGELELSSDWDFGSKLGRYKALLSVEYGNTQKASLNDTTFFFVFPWQKILVLFLSTLTVAVILVYLLYSRYERRHRKRLALAHAQYRQYPQQSIKKTKNITKNKPEQNKGHTMDLRHHKKK